MGARERSVDCRGAVMAFHERLVAFHERLVGAHEWLMDCREWLRARHKANSFAFLLLLSLCCFL